jgi:hypothetical protein
VRKKRVNTIVCKFIVSGAFQQGWTFSRDITHSTSARTFDE